MQSDMKSISAPHSEGLSEAAVQRSRTSTGRTSGPTRRSTKGQWTAEEDEILRRAVQRFKGKNWKKIAECFKDRTDVQCLHRWQKVLNPELVKGPWSKEEDEIIVEMVHRYGPKKWSTIAQHLPGRIGKQCRERWHNHLNPSINKEAWTQEEELALIRAHQIYGNRWAELTKLLPGRTDNSIKNHWNSSVKKKLDSYLASGLLEQFQGLPLVAHQNQRTSSTSLRLHGSGDDNGVKCGTVAEETSECSRESMVGCSQSASDLNNTVLPTREEFRFTEEADTIKEQSSSPVSCSEQYYVPEIPSEVGTSCSYFQTFSHNIVTSAMGDYQFHIPEIPNIPCVELEQDSSGFPTHYIAANENHEMLNAPFQSSMDLSGSTSMGHIALDSAKLDRILISDDECCRILFSDIMHSGLPPGDLTEGSNMGALGGSSDVVDVGGGSNVVDSEGGMDSLLLGCSNIPISENDGTSASLSYCPPNSDLLGTSCSELLVSGPPLADDNTLVCHKECSQGPSFGSNKQDYTSIAHDGFIYHNDAASSPCEEEGANTTGLHDQTYLEESSNLVPASSPCEEGTNTTGLHDQTYLEESSNLVPVNGFTSCSDTINSPVGVKQNLHTGRQDAGALCYEPPRFPSLDVPFLSCDLIQSGSDMQQEYSPLGIRQLMMSSMNCITPFRLWDSPLRDGSPDAVLKSAAKTFTGTPSILKKRSRDLLSPLSDRRVDKKLYLTCSLTKEFSRLDVMLEEDVTNKSSLSSDSKKSQGSSGEDKENLDPALEGGEEMVDRGDGKTKVHTDGTAQNLQHPPAVHVEDNLTDMLLFSPEQLGIRVDRAFFPSSRTPKNLYRKILGTLSEQAMASETISGNPCLVVNSPVSSKKNHATHLVSATSTQSVDSVTDNATTDVAFENFGRFGGTPFKRSIESPSAWKSPWFINSFVPGPRVDTEISIEDMGFFLSPGDRSYDAIAIMKQLNEQTASAYADALEVLGNETPKTIMKDKHPDKQKEVDQEEPASSHPANMASNVLTERRTLDFSECGTPGKQTENGKSSNAMTFSSPSSYLLKGCR